MEVVDGMIRADELLEGKASTPVIKAFAREEFFDLKDVKRLNLE